MKWHTEIRKLSELKEWENNPRKISDKAYHRLKEAIEQRGFHDIIKIDENMEIDPHYTSVIIDRWEKFTNKKAVKLN
jgi:ParB-like chromosome segregation protein Spo0J